MNRSKLRRPIAVIGAAVAGLAASIALSSPASAHHTAIEAEFACPSGEWIVTWKVRSEDTPPKATHFKLIQADATPAAVEGIAVTAEDADPAYPYAVGDVVVGEQKLPADATSASLTVRAAWNNGYKQWKPTTKTVELEGECGPSVPPTTAPPVTEPPATQPPTTEPPATTPPLRRPPRRRRPRSRVSQRARSSRPATSSSSRSSIRRTARR
ncbi:hypothetical protein ACFQ1L_43515 [Phytohabitans flavus]|uniref:hypothetical protein n=1 Tax=Phytohabitans flavus TaxID=1076124 RepID=UPI00362CD67C